MATPITPHCGLAASGNPPRHQGSHQGNWPQSSDRPPRRLVLLQEEVPVAESQVLRMLATAAPPARGRPAARRRRASAASGPRPREAGRRRRAPAGGVPGRRTRTPRTPRIPPPCGTARGSRRTSRARAAAPSPRPRPHTTRPGAADGSPTPRRACAAHARGAAQYSHSHLGWSDSSIALRFCGFMWSCLSGLRTRSQARPGHRHIFYFSPVSIHRAISAGWHPGRRRVE